MSTWELSYSEDHARHGHSRDYWRGFWDCVFGHEFDGWNLDSCGPPSPETALCFRPRPRMTSYQAGWEEGCCADELWGWANATRGRPQDRCDTQKKMST